LAVLAVVVGEAFECVEAGEAYGGFGVAELFDCLTVQVG
jgi:hypothetical protein